jgi:hypothetical protein
VSLTPKRAATDMGVPPAVITEFCTLQKGAHQFQLIAASTKTWKTTHDFMSKSLGKDIRPAASPTFFFTQVGTAVTYDAEQTSEKLTNWFDVSVIEKAA